MVDSDLRIICTSITMTNKHDFKLFLKSKLPIKKDTTICVDTGYIGLTKHHQNTEIPKKKSKYNPLSSEDKKQKQIKIFKKSNN